LPVSSRKGGLGWVLQALTGAVLTAVVVAHLVRVHLQGSYKGLPTYGEVLMAFKNPLVVASELALLVAALYHALYGLHMVLVEAKLVSEGKSRKMLSTLGILLFAYALLLTLYLAAKPYP